MLEFILQSSNPERKFSKAVRHMQDALLIRPPNNDMDLHKLNSRIHRAHHWYWHPYWKLWLTLMTLLYLIQCFFEPAHPFSEKRESVFDEQENVRYWLYTQEFIIMMSYTWDAVLAYRLLPSVRDQNNRRKRAGWKYILQHDWTLPAKVGLTLLFWVDAGSFYSMYAV